MTSRALTATTTLLLLLACAASGTTREPVQAAREADPLGPGPQWRGPVRPTASNEVFATGNGCSMCHSVADTASAMRSATGDDVSPHGLWQATMMANSFRDPYWRATMEREVAARPEGAAQIEALCLRCHAPMAHHTALLGGQPPRRLADLADDPLAEDGVSCTVCHKIEPQGLGTEASFSGQARIGRDRAIYGPFADPASGPMRMHTGYEPQLGAHVRSAALCGSCHTLTTHPVPGGAGFKEQTPYLELRNSAFSDEGGRTADSRTCQECHMPDMGSVRIARNPGGRDFLIDPRPFRAHAFLGGNAFLLDMLARHREELGVQAPAVALQRAAQATRAQLAERTATVSVSELRREDGRLAFEVEVRNLTGHKLPTGYPARRAWLHVQVRAGNELVFESGGFDREGRLRGVDDELLLPHRAQIDSPDEVQVYEMVAADAEGRATTTLVEMATRLKDTRLLPRGWKPDGPHADVTAPVGVGSDPDFVGGGDTVAYRVPLPAGVEGRLRVLAYLRYQTVPPAWVAPLRAVEGPAARRFVGYYDEADRTPETLAIGQQIER